MWSAANTFYAEHRPCFLSKRAHRCNHKSSINRTCPSRRRAEELKSTLKALCCLAGAILCVLMPHIYAETFIIEHRCDFFCCKSSFSDSAMTFLVETWTLCYFHLPLSNCSLKCFVVDLTRMQFWSKIYRIGDVFFPWIWDYRCGYSRFWVPLRIIWCFLTCI